MAKISLINKIALKLRRLPVGRIENAMTLAESAGLSISMDDLSTHVLCGGCIEAVVEALILANQEGVPASWNELCAIDLASPGQKFDVLSAARASTQVREFTFTRLGSDPSGELAGTCQDGSRVRAECHVVYRLPVSHVFALRLEPLQESLSTRIAALIFAAPNPTQLETSRASHEASLLVLARSVMPTVQKVTLKFEK